MQEQGCYVAGQRKSKEGALPVFCPSAQHRKDWVHYTLWIRTLS